MRNRVGWDGLATRRMWVGAGRKYGGRDWGRKTAEQQIQRKH
ncbi:MAG: hypothetical protein R3E31_08060 [Chloroflexota bacterium]